MNKGKLIELIKAAASVTGDVEFSDTGKSLVSLAAGAELNRPAICMLINEVNALSEVIFDKFCLPFLVMKKSDSKCLLLSDFDGEVNFEKKSNAIALMLMVRAIENLFGQTPNHKPDSVSEKAIDEIFLSYAKLFAVGELISPLERAQALSVSLVQSQINDMSAALAKSLEDGLGVELGDDSQKIELDLGASIDAAAASLNDSLDTSEQAPQKSVSAESSASVDPFRNAF